MTSPVRRDASFVIRIWWERGSKGPAVWRGQVVHVQTGQIAFFRRKDTLIAFIERWSGAGEVNGALDRPARQGDAGGHGFPSGMQE